MKLVTITKLLLILILPFLIFLLVLNFAGFDSTFYKEKFTEYNVGNISSLHEKVMGFITGKNNDLTNEFNDREKKHLVDVKNLIKISTISLYIFIILFVILLLISAFMLKVNNKIVNFVGKVLVFGGFLTIGLAALLFLLINSDFASTFESFHRLFFEKGTYTFDPAKEVIVKLYPEQLFMDLVSIISKWVVISAVIIMLLGFLSLYISKNKKNK